MRVQLKSIAPSMIVLAAMVGCHSSGRSSPADQQNVLATAATIRAGLLAGSAEQVRPQVGEELSVSHRGVTQSREEYLDSIRSGDIRYISIEETDQRVRIYDSVAIVTGKRALNLTWGGREFSPKLQFTAVYAKRHGKWLLVAYHSDELREPVAPTTKP